jgi:hypothetical protein
MVQFGENLVLQLEFPLFMLLKYKPKYSYFQGLSSINLKV